MVPIAPELFGSIRLGRLLGLAVVCIVVLVLVHLLFGDQEFFNLTETLSLAGWFSNGELLLAGLLAFLIARLEAVRNIEEPGRFGLSRAWHAVALVFLYLSLDGLAALTRTLVSRWFPQPSDLALLFAQIAPWPVLLAAVVAVVAVSVGLVILRRFLPYRVPAWWTLAAVAGWLGALAAPRLPAVTSLSESFPILKGVVEEGAHLVGNTAILFALAVYTRSLALATPPTGAVQAVAVRRWAVVTVVVALLALPAAVGVWAGVRSTAFAHARLAETLARQEQWVEAADEYRQALARDPRNPGLQHGLGVALYFQSRFDEAILAYREAIKLDRDFVPALRDLGVAYYRIRRYDDAVAAQRRILEIRPTDLRTHLDLAKTYKILGDTGNAIETIERALQYQPEAAELHAELGNLYERQGNVEQATSHWQTSLSLRPRQPGARDLQTKLRIYEAKRRLTAPGGDQPAAGRSDGAR